MDRKEKTFDAVRMVRQIRDEHHEKLEGKSWKERVAFYEKEAKALREETKERHTAA